MDRMTKSTIIDDETKKKKVKVHQVVENCDANKLEV
jgi:hypothetical protein